MKNFFKKISLFTVVFLFLCFFSITISRYLININKTLFTFENKTTIFLGDSRTETSVNDKILRECVNLSLSGENYLYVYLKLKRIFTYNHQVKNIVVGYNYNSLKEERDDWYYSDMYIKDRMVRYFYLLSSKEYKLLFKNNLKSALFGLVKSIQAPVAIFQVLTKKKLYGEYKIGGYKPLIHVFSKRNINIDNIEYKFKESQNQITYLKKISKFCMDNNVNLILLNPPTIYKANKQQIDFYKKFYKTNLENNTLIDLSALSIPDSYFADSSHMNKNGAKMFSEYLNNYFKEKGILK